jgi:hypothetical protein
VSAGWINAYTVVSRTHAGEFEAVLEEALEPSSATAVLHPFLRVRLRDIDDEVLLLMALSRLAQPYRVVARQYAFPAGWEEELEGVIAFHSIRASVVPSICYRLELRNDDMLDNLHAALNGRAPTFGPTYPRIGVS